MLYPVGKLTSVTPGTPVSLASVLPAFLQGYVIQSIDVLTFSGNTGKVYFGGPTLNKTTGVGCYVGTGLAASQTFNMFDNNASINRPINNPNVSMNTNNIFFDVDNSGEGFGGYIVY